MHWNYLVLIICLFLAVITVIKEYRRGNKQRLGLRVAASLIGIAALGAIALPITYRTEANQPANEAVLLTPGFNDDSLNKFKNDALYTIDAAINTHYPKAKLITPDQVKTSVPAIVRLHILGYGLTKEELNLLGDVPVIFHPALYPDGIVSVSWSEKLKQGQPFVVQGKFNHTNTRQLRLILKELNTSVDSMTIERRGNINFEFSSLPKSTGRLADHLLVIAGHDTLENEGLPLMVESFQPLKILVLAASPDFENKFLRNWLAANGFAIAVRSSISKDKISMQFVNMEQLPIAHLSAPVLDKFDVLIADLSVLKSLSGTEAAVLKQQVNQNGLGLIIRADTILKTATLLQSDFTIYKETSNDQKALSLRLLGGKAFSKNSGAGQLFINYKEGMQSLLSDAQNRVLAGVNLLGSGKIVCITLDNTYTWMLSGNKNDYSAFWSLLIGKAAKVIPQPENWTIATPFPAINMPVTVQVETAAPPGQILMDNESASPKQNGELPFQWQSSWWPAQAGWHALQHRGGPAAWIYIYNATDWAAIKAVNKILDTKQYVSGIPLAGVTKQIHRKVKIPVPKVYFYMLLLICCTFLWAEGKIPPK